MSEEQKTEKKNKKIEEGIIDRIQDTLDRAHKSKSDVIDRTKQEVMAKISTVKDFQEYFRPYQERRTLMWNELGAKSSYDIPINIHAGKPLIPASFTQTITLYYNEPSREQMQRLDGLRGKSQDLERLERLSNTLPMSEIEKKGIKIPNNFLTISTEAAELREGLLTQKIIALCGVDEDTAKHVALISHSQSLDDILDSWEYKARTGFPNSEAGKDGTQNTSQLGYQ